MGGKGFCNQKRNVFIGVLGYVRIRKLVETHDVLSHSGALALACSGKVQCSGTGQLVPPLSSPLGCLVASLVASFAPQSFAHHHQSALRCSWPGKGQKLFSPCIVKTNIDNGQHLHSIIFPGSL